MNIQEQIEAKAVERKLIITKVQKFRARHYRTGEEATAAYNDLKNRMELLRLEIKELLKEEREQNAWPSSFAHKNH